MEAKFAGIDRLSNAMDCCVLVKVLSLLSLGLPFKFIISVKAYQY